MSNWTNPSNDQKRPGMSDLLEKKTLKTQLLAMFRPSAPIDKHSLFAGRQVQTQMLIGAISQVGQHVILYGERGLGKTSLARSLAESLPAAGFRVVHTDTINCDSTDDFSSIWHRALRELSHKVAASGAYTVGGTKSFTPAKDERKEIESLVPEKVTPDDVRRALSTFAGKNAVIVFDEFDRITNKEAKTLMADTIKNLSDHAIDTTLVIVGVAKSVLELISEHRSVDRAIVEVPMTRMTPEELAQIVAKGLSNLRLTMTDSVLAKIVTLSFGLPHYTHLLALESGKAAVDRDSYTIEDADLTEALNQVVRSKYSVGNEYFEAVRSNHKGSKHKLTLLACAPTKLDRQGFFTAPDAGVILTILTGDRKAGAGLQKHLNEFSTDKRGNALQRVGSNREVRYRFSNPLLQPYVIISSISENLIGEDKVWASQDPEVVAAAAQAPAPATPAAETPAAEAPAVEQTAEQPEQPLEQTLASEPQPCV
jgi:Cdc6-like AAA superfamily ATPase